MLDGNIVPFLLRLARMGRFELMGGAYVHRTMHGEAAPDGERQFSGIDLV